VSKLNIYTVGSIAFAIPELMIHVCENIKTNNKQIGTRFTFLADNIKNMAPNTADPASSMTGTTVGCIVVTLAALGSIIINKQPASANNTPIISSLCGLVPRKIPIKTIKSP
jgi:hypothetical protein